ncbi:spondin domain-containing protein [Pseudoalteromonas sp. 20-92]|uniref:spondin domain-containing protein n=1 Tax=Pseudoalteromonas sp. 20-92 TaxID=2969394 RepID=UPI0027AE3EC7|nr:spondin domain-containing protein [Pseudoalteromonas sp. 20-92]MDQ2044125.1 spondin domain-containing protein [Pseudoalteromonas sp. 20-92]
MSSFKNLKRSAIVLALATTLAACGGSDSDNNELEQVAVPEPTAVIYQFDVTVSNLTAGQPFSPIAVIAHKEGALWQIGSPASVGLELMAEGGDNSQLLTFENGIANASSENPVGPGGTTTVTITTDTLDALKLSFATMMVNTNDGFTGLSALDVSALAVGDSIARNTVAYDSGTEANTESAGTFPGPADNGEGFNEVRDDVNFVARHQGVVTNEDGLSSSILSPEHRFDNPLARVVITRTQ